MSSVTSIAMYSLLFFGEYAMSDQVPCDTDPGHCDASVSNTNAPVLLQGVQGKTHTTMKINDDELNILEDYIKGQVGQLGRELKSTFSDSIRRVQWVLIDSNTRDTCSETCRRKHLGCSEDHWHMVSSEDSFRNVMQDLSVINPKSVTYATRINEVCKSFHEVPGTYEYLTWRPYVCEGNCGGKPDSCHYTTNTIARRCDVRTGYSTNRRLCPCIPQ